MVVECEDVHGIGGPRDGADKPFDRALLGGESVCDGGTHVKQNRNVQWKVGLVLEERYRCLLLIVVQNREVGLRSSVHILAFEVGDAEHQRHFLHFSFQCRQGSGLHGCRRQYNWSLRDDMTLHNELSRREHNQVPQKRFGADDAGN